jgi:DNA replication protein DnaC
MRLACVGTAGANRRAECELAARHRYQRWRVAQMAELAAAAHNSGFWIDFKEARRAVDTLIDLAHDEPDERPACVILVGQSGMGKTSILREAHRRIMLDFPQPCGWSDTRYTPMLRTLSLRVRPRSRST